MCSTCLQLNIQQRISLVALFNSKKGQRAADVPYNCHPGSIRRIACNWLVNLSCLLIDSPMDQRNIRFEYSSIAKLIRQVFQALFCFGYDKESGSVAIESVNDSRPNLTRTLRRQFLKMIRKCVCQGAGVNSGSRVNNEAGWFINYEQLIVLVNDIDGDGFRNKRGGGRRS